MTMSSKRPLPFRLSHQNPVPISLLPSHAQCRAHHQPQSANLIISGKVNKSKCSSLCSFLHPSTRYTSSLFGSIIFFSTPLSNFSVYTMFFTLCDRPSFTPPQNKRKNHIFFSILVYGFRFLEIRRQYKIL